MLRPSPNNGAQRLPNDDDDELESAIHHNSIRRKSTQGRVSRENNMPDGSTKLFTKRKPTESAESP